MVSIIHPGKDIHLKPLNIEIVERLVPLIQNKDNFEKLNKYVLWVGKPDLKDLLNHWYNESLEGKAIVMVAEYKNKIAGLFKILDINQTDQTGELGYLLLPAFTKKGIALKSCKSILEVAFNNLRLNQVYAETFSNNMDSQTLLRRLGAKYINTTPKAGVHNGEFYNEQRWVVTKTLLQ
jgi:RimJ/RimL family protein N-acetyltransferase